MKPDCVVIVFAKAPVPGFAKTRLAAAIGDERAARLAGRMLDETLRQTLAAAVGPVELCCAPDASHAVFEQAGISYPVRLTEQGDGDLGVRMRRACERALERHAQVLLIGTDAPQLRAEHLHQAASMLASHDAVFVPVWDGGYVLVGLSRGEHMPFAGIAWGTSQVMRQTRERLADLGMRWMEMPALHDVDEPEDLVHVPAEWLE